MVDDSKKDARPTMPVDLQVDARPTMPVETGASNRPDYKKCCRDGLWTLREAAQLLVGLPPIEDPRSGYAFGESRPQFLEFEEIVRVAETSFAAGKLGNRVSYIGTSDCEHEQLAPVDFVRWANGKGFDIPDELAHLLEESDKFAGSTQNAEWNYKHDTKLLKIARWVIKEYWEEKGSESAPSKEAIVTELQEKYQLSKNEAEAVDIVTRHDDRRNAKYNKKIIVPPNNSILFKNLMSKYS